MLSYKEGPSQLCRLHHYLGVLGNLPSILLSCKVRVTVSGKEQEFGLIHVCFHCARHLMLPLKCLCHELYGLI